MSSKTLASSLLLLVLSASLVPSARAGAAAAILRKNADLHFVTDVSGSVFINNDEVATHSFVDDRVSTVFQRMDALEARFYVCSGNYELSLR